MAVVTSRGCPQPEGDLIEVRESGFIYQDTTRRSRHAFFPSLAQAPEGDVICGLDLGASMTSLDRRSYCCRSEDGGRTWSEPALMFEPDESAHRVSTSCRLSRVLDELVGFACLFDRSHEDAGHTNPRTGGFVRTDLAMIRSADGGGTWSAPRPVVPAIDWRHFEICSPAVALDAGRLVWPTSIWPDWEGRCDFQPYRAIALVSDDGGRTWPHVSDVFDLTASGCAAWEQRQVQLSDGRVLAVRGCARLRQAVRLGRSRRCPQNAMVHAGRLPVRGTVAGASSAGGPRCGRHAPAEAQVGGIVNSMNKVSARDDEGPLNAFAAASLSKRCSEDRVRRASAGYRFGE